jgi:acetyltransferase-like isoleucine patch superfamily enzyme
METHQPIWNKRSTSFLKRVAKYFILHVSRQFFIPPSFRARLLSMSGVKFSNRKTVFIGVDVLFDNLKSTKTFIGDNVTITTGTKIINHFPVISDNGVKEYKMGDVVIGDNVFIGMNSLIIKSVTIGDNVVIGAGSVINKSIPKNAIVAGNPAKIIGYVNK